MAVRSASPRFRAADPLHGPVADPLNAVLFPLLRILCGMASCPRSVPVIREVPPPDPGEEADEDTNDGDSLQQLTCTLGVPPTRGRQDTTNR